MHNWSKYENRIQPHPRKLKNAAHFLNKLATLIRTEEMRGTLFDHDRVRVLRKNVSLYNLDTIKIVNFLEWLDGEEGSNMRGQFIVFYAAGSVCELFVAARTSMQWAKTTCSWMAEAASVKWTFCDNGRGCSLILCAGLPGACNWQKSLF